MNRKKVIIVSEELDLKYVFDELISSTKAFNATVKTLNETLVKHNEQFENHEENNEKEHKEIKNVMYWIGGIIGGLFSLCVIAVVILAIGKELIGQENIMILLKGVMQ